MSGVYIKDTDMPRNCHSCFACLFRFCQAGDRELTEKETRPTADRPSDCPLIPVPDHGRLIDADALEEHKFVGIFGDMEKNSYAVGWNTAIEAIVENAPTVIPKDYVDRPLSNVALLRSLPLESLAEWLANELSDSTPVDWLAWLTEVNRL